MWFVYIMTGNVLWSVADVSMSMIMNRMQRSPVVVSWYLGVVVVTVMSLLLLVLPVQPLWIGPFAASASLAYVGNLLLFRLLSRVDVSVSSAAWVFLSIGIAAGGMLLFGETWSVVQAVGALLSIAGVLLLAFWHKHVSWLRTCIWLAAVGFAYVPVFLVQKAALLDGVPVTTAFFVPFFCQQSLAVLFPLTVPSLRRNVLRFSGELTRPFVSMVCLWVLSSISGVYIVTRAYQAGQASLVGIAENGQPFFLIFFAWVAAKLAPRHAPRELLTSQSVGIKTISFVIVFTGLGLLAIG